MKKIFYLALILMLTYSFVKADCDLEGCDNPAWTYATAEWPVGEGGCSIWVRYEHRIVTCNGIQHNEVRVIGWVAAINYTCPELDYPGTILELIYLHLFSGALPDLILPPLGECISSYAVSGPACWEMVYKPVGPRGAGFYGSPCASTPICCKNYQVCRDIIGNISVTPLSYTPVQCSTIIGPESHKPCHSNCQ